MPVELHAPLPCGLLQKWGAVPAVPAGPCRQWSNSSAGATSLLQCLCMARGSGANGSCTIPSPFQILPACSPLSTCKAYVQQLFPFALMALPVRRPTNALAGRAGASPGRGSSRFSPRSSRIAPTAPTVWRDGAARTACTSWSPPGPSSNRPACAPLGAQFRHSLSST